MKTATKVVITLGVVAVIVAVVMYHKGAKVKAALKPTEGK
jgi:hypothetical protein